MINFLKVREGCKARGKLGMLFCGSKERAEGKLYNLTNDNLFPKMFNQWQPCPWRCSTNDNLVPKMFNQWKSCSWRCSTNQNLGLKMFNQWQSCPWRCSTNDNLVSEDVQPMTIVSLKISNQSQSYIKSIYWLLFETLQTCFISEALSEGWAVAFPQADISWMVAAANNITDIPVHDSDLAFCTNYLKII